LAAEPSLPIDVLEAWLGARIEGASPLRVLDLEQPKSGYSATTLMVPIEYTCHGEARAEKLVLRMENPEPAIYPQQAPGIDVEVELQYRVMEAIAQAGVAPIAPLLGYEADASVLGQPFFVMGYVQGEVPVENPIYTSLGFFAEASPAQRCRMVEDGIRTLARIHSLDWRRAGLEWLVAPGTTPGIAYQLEIWEAYSRRELGDRVHPPLDRAFAWLKAHLPEASPPGFSWGDSRPGNMIWRDFQCACVTDFENAAIAPPELDLGWWLMFDRWSHETYGVGRLEGEPTRAEQTALYGECAGHEVGDTFFYELTAAARYAAIVVRVMNRMVAEAKLPADQMLWRNNPAATCLDQLLAEGGIP
jgi:aminoglycoside phosphotransferase (APT) family kinase protein